jgi:hypothetical protein
MVKESLFVISYWLLLPVLICVFYFDCAQKVTLYFAPLPQLFPSNNKDALCWSHLSAPDSA